MLLFSLSTGIIVWCLAEAAGGDRWAVSPPRARALLRQAALSGVCWAVFLPLSHLDLRPMDAVLAGMVATLGALLAGRARRFALPALTASVGFALLYCGILWATMALYPETFVASWNLAALWRWRPAGLPAEELAWALCFGLLWPLVVADALGVGPRRTADGALH